MKKYSMRFLAVLSLVFLSSAHADEFDWNIAAGEGGVWTYDLAPAPSAVRAIVGQIRQAGGVHSEYMVNIVVNNVHVSQLFNGMSDNQPEVRLKGDVISIKSTGKTSCFAWAKDKYSEIPCP